MPETKVVFYREDDGTVPLLDWLDTLPAKLQDKCRARIERLGRFGHELRRPVADFLRDDIYELRVAHLGVNYRMLYFFHGKAATVVSHGLVKERRVPTAEINTAIKRKKNFEADPLKHTHEET
ncbi:MAG: type II toxin-antitoxin system RelE/ParE family toxin [Phycisphaerae bacterium]|jgi:phage-related protein